MMSLNLGKICTKNFKFACGFHTTTCYEAKMVKAFRKVMGSTSKKKRVYSESPILPSASAFSQGSQEGRFSGNARRVSVLNKLFMKHISDLIVTGENATEFTNYGIEINKVQISPDYKSLNVFWVGKGLEKDEIIESVLKKNAGYLRHELSSLRVMGVVPMINFVKDKEFATIMELDARLSKADFGEDYVPIQLEDKLKTQLEIFTPLPADIKEKIQNVDNEETDDEFEDLPPMPQDVLGLNHAEILNKIKKAMKKSEAAHRLNNSCDNADMNFSQTVNENPLQYSRAAFKNFLEKRELLRSKARKSEKNYLPDVEYMKEEIKLKNEEYFKNMDVFDYTEDENDFIEEDVDHNKK